jgi:hypothetical protein
VLKDIGLTALYRPLPLPRHQRLRKGDLLLSSHALMAPEFARTSLGRKIFARYPSAKEWFKKELAPRIAGIVYRSLDKSFAHLELHSQNVDVLVSSRGKVRGVFVKDLLDMMHDPGAQAASGKLPRGVPTLRDREWGNLGEAGAEYGVAGFYSTYLGQLTLPGSSYSRYGNDGFHTAVRDALRSIVTRRGDHGRLSRYPEFARAFSSTSNLWQTTASLRDLLVKSNLEKSFRPDAAARRRFQQAPGSFAGSPAHPDLNAMEYGFVGSNPVAVKRGPGGLVEAYSFKFR